MTGKILQFKPTDKSQEEILDDCITAYSLATNTKEEIEVLNRANKLTEPYRQEFANEMLEEN